MSEENSILRCSSCGAELKAVSLVNTRCAYCGSVHFIKEKYNEEFVPDAIVQFKHTNDSAEKLLKAFLKDVDLVKNDKDYKIESITAMYVPCTIFNYGIDLYQKVVVLENSGEQQVERAKEKREKEMYSFVLDGSKNVDDAFILSIEPFDFSNLKAFNPIYLSGTYTEINNDKFVLNKSLQKIEKSIINQLDFVDGIVECNIYTVDKVQAYLPIWLAKVNLNSGTYNFVMNDTTSKWVSNAVKEKSTFGSIIGDIAKLILIVGLFISLMFFISAVFGKMDRLGISSIMLFIFFCGVFFNKMITDNKNMMRRRSFIKNQSEISSTPTESKVVSEKSINKNDVIQGRNIRFYLDGKQI